MSGLEILGTGSYTPELSLSNAVLENIVNTTDEWIVSRTGIRSRAIAPPDVTTLHMARTACERAIDRAGIKKRDIAVVVAATITGDYITPSLSCLLQRDLGLDENIMPIDINCACSGFLFALKTAHALLADCPDKYALVVGSEMLSRITDYSDRATCILFGDGAGAAVIKRCETGIFAFDGGARGGSDLLRCKAAYLANSPVFPRENESQPGGIFMNGGEVMRFAQRAATESILRVLNSVNRDVQAIDWFVFHQANLRILDSIVKRLSIDPDKCAVNIEHHGNTSSAACAMALDDLLRSGKTRPGETIVMSVFGAGLTYASACCQLGAGN